MIDTDASKNNGAIQIDDLLIEFFPNQKKLINIPFYEKSKKSLGFCVLHTHSYAEIFACKSGQITIRTNKSQYHLTAGDMAVIPNGVVHTKIDGDNAQWCSAGVLCSKCKSEGNKGLFDKLAPLVYGGEISVSAVSPHFYKNMEAVRQSDRVIPYLNKLMLASEFCRLAVTADIHLDNKREWSRSKLDVDRLLKLEAILSLHYTSSISNREIAEKLFLSERQLSRFVKQYYGVPLHTLIITKRIQSAADMLLKTDETIEAIASSVGFVGKAGFYREFQKVYGQTPLQYRKSKKM